MKKLTAAGALLLLIWTCVGANAASVEVVKGRDGDHVVLRNALLRVEVNPNDGAKVESFLFAPWGDKEIVVQKGYQGLFADHFWQEYWPGQMWAAKYTYKIVSSGPEEVAVQFSYLAQDKGVPQVAGILVEKTISLREGSKVVRDSVRLTNTNKDGRSVGYWMQNVAWLGGDSKTDLYFRPSKRGISVADSEDTNPVDAGFVRNPQAGWMAAIDQPTKQGLVFFMDYNDLWFLYNCTGANTMEWQYEAVAIPPGKSWQTEVSLVPISGLDAVTFASPQVLMSAKLTEDKAKSQLGLSTTFMATELPLASLDVTPGLETLFTNHQEAAPVQKLEKVGDTPQTLSFTLPYDSVKREPAVVRVGLQGKPAAGEAFTATPELWFGGSMSTNTNMTDGGPFYVFPAAPKVRHLLKPDTIARIHAAQPQVLFLKGLLSPSYRVAPAVRRVLPNAQITEGYMYAGVFGPTLDYFPYDYEKLMAFDLVVLSDLSRAALGDTAMEMLGDYVTHGGRLLVLGGPLGYGNGGYRGTVLDKVLPVESGGPFDLQPCATPGLTKASGALAAVAPYEFTAQNLVHRATVRPGAQALLQVGTTPIVVAGAFGTGETVCVLATPVGAQDWCASRQWRETLEKIVAGRLVP
ncbi:MAG TPA: glutamine amidotransferase [Armatimonadota bacterium]|jgi:uncharacterized membrane protein